MSSSREERKEVRQFISKNEKISNLQRLIQIHEAQGCYFKENELKEYKKLKQKVKERILKENNRFVTYRETLSYRSDFQIETPIGQIEWGDMVTKSLKAKLASKNTLAQKILSFRNEGIKTSQMNKSGTTTH